MAKKLFFLFFLISCSTSNASVEVNSEISQTTITEALTVSLDSEEILIQILEAYKSFSGNPDKSLDIIWNFAHPNNQAITGPKERFAMMLTSEPYDLIIDLKDYSYKVVYENDENIHYEVNFVNQNNSYLVLTWVFEKTLCFEKPCWRTIGVSEPQFLGSGI
ncbi:MAG: hypothetical protein O3A48_04645 [Actinomycetota bacterium]|nr:hypothetical protein [Actinomycetota bacterium]